MLNKFQVSNYKQLKNTIIALVAIFVLFPAVSFAAELYLESESSQYYQGDTFIVEVRINIQEECINTVKANLEFSQDILEAVDFSQGNSILTLWLKKPEILQDSELISFIGGIPAGFCGKVSGDIGKSNLLGKIIFKVRELNGEQFFANMEFLDSSQVLLNDGFGTPAELTSKGAVFTILSGVPEVTKEEWQEELEKDITLPEPFEIEMSQDPSIFDNKYFIIFSTTDKQTGIDHYQVKEGKRDWKRTESPYLLEDQDLKSIIKVKAVDKADNERIAEYLSKKKPFPWQIIILVLIGIGIIVWLIYKISRKR